MVILKPKKKEKSRREEICSESSANGVGSGFSSVPLRRFESSERYLRSRIKDSLALIFDTTGKSSTALLEATEYVRKQGRTKVSSRRLVSFHSPSSEHRQGVLFEGNSEPVCISCTARLDGGGGLRGRARQAKTRRVEARSALRGRRGV